MLEIEKHTCIRFEERSTNLHEEPVLLIPCDSYTIGHVIWPIYYMYSVNKDILVVLWNKTVDKDYIEFRLGKACYSSVGRDGQRQYIVLDPRCAEKHTLIHEVISVNSKTIIFENVFRFYTPLVFYTSISDQTEMSTLTLIWQLWLEQI